LKSRFGNQDIRKVLSLSSKDFELVVLIHVGEVLYKAQERLRIPVKVRQRGASHIAFFLEILAFSVASLPHFDIWREIIKEVKQDAQDDLSRFKRAKESILEAFKETLAEDDFASLSIELSELLTRYERKTKSHYVIQKWTELANDPAFALSTMELRDDKIRVKKITPIGELIKDLSQVLFLCGYDSDSNIAGLLAKILNALGIKSPNQEAIRKHVRTALSGRSKEEVNKKISGRYPRVCLP
jgi:hypothetical protein